MPEALSKDLRERVIAAWESKKYASWLEIAETFGVVRATVNRWIRLFKATGAVNPAPHGGGLEPLIPEEKLLAVWELVEDQPDRTVDELAAAYEAAHGVTVSRATMGRALVRLGLSRKKTIVSSERDRAAVIEARSRFVAEPTTIDPAHLVFIDESGSHIAMTREYAWSPSGTRVHGRVPRNRGVVLTMLGELGLDGVRAMMTNLGGTGRDVFLRFVREYLLPALQPGDVVVMDNLGAHHATGVRDLIASAGARVLYMPAYSPDLNPIELCWSKVKGLLRSAGARTVTKLVEAVGSASARITPNDARGWFRHCGYGAQPE